MSQQIRDSDRPEKRLTILCPTGHLGFYPFERDSFRRGVAREPDAIVADSGSSDIGPYPLGADVAHSHENWQRADLEAMLLAARRLKVPMIVGSASDTGTDRGVDQYLGLIKDIAREHRLPPFKLAAVYAEQSLEAVHDWLDDPQVQLDPLDGVEDADASLVAATDRVVAVMGPEPIMAALEGGADVVVTGRACDDALFAAVAMHHGVSQATATHMGKSVECASLCCEPFMAKESVLVEVDGDGDRFLVEPMHPEQRCTPSSLAGHLLYERRDPFRLVGPGGVLQLDDCRYTAVDERRTAATGAVFAAREQYRVKLEGAGYVGERAMTIVGVRDPLIIESLDQAIAFSRRRVRQQLELTGGGDEYQLFFHRYGQDAVTAGRPASLPAAAEVGLVIEAVAGDREAARQVVLLASRNLFFAQVADQMANAGGIAFLLDETLTTRPVYEWTLNHSVPVEAPGALFRTRWFESSDKGREVS